MTEDIDQEQDLQIDNGEEGHAYAYGGGGLIALILIILLLVWLF